MNTIAKATIAALALAVSALPVLASAQEPATADAPISANGHLPSRHGWLTTSGPDGQGRYAVSISLADLDAGTARGKAKIVSRIARGAAELCDLTAEGPKIDGYFDRGTRDCRAEARASAMARLGNGARISMLTPIASRVAR